VKALVPSRRADVRRADSDRLGAEIESFGTDWAGCWVSSIDGATRRWT